MVGVVPVLNSLLFFYVFIEISDLQAFFFVQQAAKKKKRDLNLIIEYLIIET